MAVYQSLLSAGDTILGMKLDAGGHLTHGASVSASGRLYHAITYGVNECGHIDYESVAKLAEMHQPKLIIAGFSAFSGIIDWAKFRQIADAVGAYLLADIAHVSGLIAAGVYPSPLPYAHVVTSTTHKSLRGPRGGLILSDIADEALHKKLNFGIFPCTQGGPFMHSILAKAVAFHEASTESFVTYQKQVKANAKAMLARIIAHGFDVVSGVTDNHMFLMDFSKNNFTGKQAEHWLEAVHMTANKNTVPGDKRSPFQTSGLRIGTCALTTRGMQVAQMETIADMICQRLSAPEDIDLAEKILAEIASLCAVFPVPC